MHAYRRRAEKIRKGGSYLILEGVALHKKKEAAELSWSFEMWDRKTLQSGGL